MEIHFKNALTVIKKDGRREEFKVSKLFESIKKSLTYAGLESEADDVLQSVIDELLNRKEVNSTEISDLVEKSLISNVIINPSFGKAAKAYVLAKIYNEVYGKGVWKYFSNVDAGFTYSALRVLYQRYLLKDPKSRRVIETPLKLIERVASNIAGAEPLDKRSYWVKEFTRLISERKFIPNSPTLFNAGTKLGILSACFVIPVRDAIVTENNDGIYDSVRTQAIVFQQGGGCGFNFSELRPEGDTVASTGGVASGPLSFMRIFDVNTDVIKQGGKRRGANMGVLHIWHPDIMKFIKAKTGDGKDSFLQNFNISVGMYDYFMKAIAEDGKVPLINPRKTSTDGLSNSLKYAIVWARHYMSEEWVQEFILDELEKHGGSISLDETLIITWDEALAIAEAEGAITGWLDPAQVFDEITKGAWESGDPGLLFIGTINRRHPTWYLGKINATNPCVAEDTRVLTPNGWLRAREIFEAARKKGVAIGVSVDESLLGEGGEPIAYHTQLITAAGREVIYRAIYGRELKLLIPKKTEAWVWSLGKKHGLKVETKERYEVTVTQEHKFLTKEGWKLAKDLKAGDKIYLGRIHPAFIEKVIDKGNEIDDDIAFALGWLYGDGSLNNSYVAWYFSDEDSAAEEKVRAGIGKLGGNPLSHTYVQTRSRHRIQYNKGTRLYRNVMELIGGYIEKSSQSRLPELVWGMSPKSLLAFLKGFFTADGYVGNDGSIKLTNSSLQLLKDVQVILTQLGIYSVIYERAYESALTYTPSIGGKEASTGRRYYELLINGYSRKIFKELIGFEDIHKVENLSLTEAKRDSLWVTVAEIKDVGLVDFYDFTVPGTHNYIGNGIIHHNCGEEPLLEWESCNLGSINLEKYVIEGKEGSRIDWLGLAKDIRIAVRFLDDVITVAKYPVPQLGRAARRARKVGLGVMGWAHMLIKLGIRYDSPDAAYLGYKLAEWIAYNAYKASTELAREKGAFPAWHPKLYRPFWETAKQFEKIAEIAKIGKLSKRAGELLVDRPRIDWEKLKEKMLRQGLRNAALLSIAPTGTISIIAGTSSSIEPVFALAFTRIVTVGTFIEVDPLFLEALKKYGLDNHEVIQLVAETGSIAHNPFMPKPLREIFRTAHDILPKWHVIHQAIWQQWVDAGVSKTVNLRNEAKVEDVKEVYLLAWALGCKGITVYRDKSKSQQVISFGVKIANKLEKLSLTEDSATRKEVHGAETIIPDSALISGKVKNENPQPHKESSDKVNKFRITTIALEEGDVGDCSTCEY